MKIKLPRLFLYLLAIVFIINLFQSFLTELIFDEAYYWHYAQDLAWGYFDHPPMVAFLIKISGFLFSGELGVRFMSCILSAGTIVFLWLLVDSPKKQDYVAYFYILVFSMTLLNAYGFLMLPDTPMLFFTAMFLWLYKKFIHTPSYIMAVALGIVMAALMYSKYHAVLVILFVLLSNVRLVFNKYAWIAVCVALVCYIPHLAWLYENQFVSINYHLFERPNRSYDFNDFTLGYFLNLLALFGLTFPWIYYALFKTKGKDHFTKALLFLTYGVLVFFFLSSFQRRIQTQWLIVICIPLVIIVFNYMLHNETGRKWIYRTGMANIILLLFLRIGLIYEPFFPIVFETHGNREWVQDLYEQVGDIPVIFENSYREAPMYSFYSGVPAYSLNNIYYRQNQYSIDGTEAAVQHRKVLYTAKRFKSGDVNFTSPKGRVYFGNYLEDFESFRKLRCFVSMDNDQIPAQHSTVQIKVYNPYEEEIPINKLKFAAAYLDTFKKVQEVTPMQVRLANGTDTSLGAKDTTVIYATLPASQLANPSYFKITIAENDLIWGLNGSTIKIN